MVCVDASIVVQRFTSAVPAAVELWREWEQTEEPLVAPGLLLAEVANSLHQLYRAGRISAGDVTEGVTRTAQRVELYHAPEISVRAAEIAVQRGLAATYDAHYLALAEELGLVLYTTDRRLADKVSAQFQIVLVGS